MDDGIRERHGMKSWEPISGTIPITLWEDDSVIWLSGCARERKMTPTEARYLARKLYRLARRIDKRNEEQI